MTTYGNLTEILTLGNLTDIIKTVGNQTNNMTLKNLTETMTLGNLTGIISTLGNKTNNMTLDNLVGIIMAENNLTDKDSNKLALDRSPLDKSNIKELLPNTEKLIEMANNLNLDNVTTEELKTAIISFPDLKNYFTELLTGQKISVNTGKPNEKSNQESSKVKKVKKDIPLQIEITGVTALG